MRRLLRAYPPGHRARPDAGAMDPRPLPPLDELVFTVLSQNTSDVNRDRAWSSMRRAYPTWEAVAKARSDALARSIRVGGLAQTKAPRIKEILREVRRREGGYALDRLAGLSDHDVRDYLLTLPGIGPKTAACVLAFSLGRDRLPVDTHVGRVARRLGLVSAKASPEETQVALERLVPPPKRVEVHRAMIALGRTVCRARTPACGACILAELCPTGVDVLTGRAREARAPRR